jgi:purine catabolism regulator
MLTVEGLVSELGLELISGGDAAKAHLRWVHSTELLDPTPWLRGGELLLTTGLQLQSAKAQRELVARLAEHKIGGLGFGIGFAHKRLPPALADEARKRSFPLFEVPYELPFIAITERAFAQLLDERYEMLQRSMAGDVLAEALTGRLYPEELQARLRPFGIGERSAVLAFVLADPGRSVDPAVAAPLVERFLAREDLLGERVGGPQKNGAGRQLGSLVAIRAGLLCAVIDGGPSPPANGAHAAEHRAPGEVDPIALARKIRADLTARLGGEVRASASRVAPTQSLRLSFHEARCALEAVRLQQNGNGAEVVATYADLGAFQLLLSLQDDDALLTYCRGVLGPVEAGEGEYGDELLRSLDVFIEHNGHWEKAATALYCHRHTLRYRIRRVEQLTGRDFSTARDRIEFWLALRGRELAR